MSKQNIGKVVQVIGPVLDIRFEDGQLPELLNAIEIQSGDRKIVAEVAQHIGVSQMTVSRVERQALASLRDALTEGEKEA